MDLQRDIVFLEYPCGTAVVARRCAAGPGAPLRVPGCRCESGFCGYPSSSADEIGAGFPRDEIR